MTQCNDKTPHAITVYTSYIDCINAISTSNKPSFSILPTWLKIFAHASNLAFGRMWKGFVLIGKYRQISSNILSGFITFVTITKKHFKKIFGISWTLQSKTLLFTLIFVSTCVHFFSQSYTPLFLSANYQWQGNYELPTVKVSILKNTSLIGLYNVPTYVIDYLMFV